MAIQTQQENKIKIEKFWKCTPPLTQWIHAESYQTARKTEEIREVILEDKHLSALAELFFQSWLYTKAEIQNKLQLYWSFRNKIVIIDRIAIKERRIIIPTALKGKAIKQLYINHRSIEKQE